MKDDETDDTETLMTRRDALKGGSAAAVAAGSFLLQQHLVGVASAQTTEPQIQLGDTVTLDVTSGELGVQPSLSTPAATIAGKTGIGVPSSGFNPGLTFDTWETLDANRPVMYIVTLAAETDGSNRAEVVCYVDESGGTTPDYRFADVICPPSIASGEKIQSSGVTLLPPGSQVQVNNLDDPNNANTIVAQWGIVL